MSVCSLTSHPSIGKEDEKGCIFEGRPARNRVVFINLSGARRREGKAPENRASLTWNYARMLPAASSHEGRKTPSRRLPLMKTTRFLAGPPRDLCASGNWRELSFSGLTYRGQEEPICDESPLTSRPSKKMTRANRKLCGIDLPHRSFQAHMSPSFVHEDKVLLERGRRRSNVWPPARSKCD